MCDSPRMGCAWRTSPYIYVARTSNNRVIMACEHYCCLLPKCEALCTCRLDFRSQQNGAVTRMWRSCRVQPSHKERAIGAVRCKIEGMLLQPLRRRCVKCVIHHERDVREEQHHTYMWREQAIMEWSWHANSIVACCHSAKLCVHAAWDFRSQQSTIKGWAAWMCAIVCRHHTDLGCYHETGGWNLFNKILNLCLETAFRFCSYANHTKTTHLRFWSKIARYCI